MVFRLLFEQEAEKAAAAKVAKEAAKTDDKPTTSTDAAPGDATTSSDAAERDTSAARKSPANE